MADGGGKTVSTRSKLLGSVFGFLCVFGCFLLMAREGHTPHGTVFGSLLLVGAVAGLCAALGLLAPGPDAIAVRDTALYPLPDEPRWFAPIITVPAAVLIVVLLTAAFGTAALPGAIIAALLVLLLSAWRRPGLFVVVLSSALYLPLLGSFGLWDPWETHYGEVTREILARDDWVSLWWAQDGWFWSKPILIFWAEALVWAGSSVGFRAGHLLVHSEWVLRLPIYAMSVAGLWSLYYAVQRVWNRRAAVLGVAVLATTPYYAFLTRQAVTDMPFVANMTVAMMLLILACVEDPDRRVTSVRVGRIALSLQHAVLLLVIGVGLPQFIYLASRNIAWLPPFAWHHDVFNYGSAGNNGVPGNAAPALERPAVAALWLEPLVQGLVGVLALAPVIWMIAREQRAQALYMFAFYAFCALAFMAKGIPGFALPGLVVLLYLISARRFDLLFEGRLRVAAGSLTLIVLGMPWFVAMYVRHGSGFTDRILIHDHINRLTSGVHGDSGSIQYYIWQLGYGLFPWIGLTPAGLAAWLWTPGARDVHDERARTQRDTLQFLGLWFAASFTLFSATTTKFHHYIFPAVPPAAVLIGLLLDRMLPQRAFSRAGHALWRTLAAMVGACVWVLAAAGLRGDPRGIVPAQVPESARARWVLDHPWPAWLCALLFVLGFVLFALSVWRPRAVRSHTPQPLQLGAAMLSGAVLLAFVGRDLAWHIHDQPPGSERLIHLFVYNYTRGWPDYLDYRAILFGFGCVAFVTTLGCAVPRLRAAAASGLLGLGLAFCVFCLDVYMLDLTPHWTQQGLIERYYAERKSKDEPLLAWQMNWKGENFYTGNHVYVFVELDNKAMLEWIGKNTGKHVFFMLEHSRLDRLKRLLAPRTLEQLTTARDCNKFVLVRGTL
jgi:4-amino-4-deoxy-L-arabinose transferase-like glycosyltransferase